MANTSTDVDDEDEEVRDEYDEPPALMNLDELAYDLDLPTDEDPTDDSPTEVMILVDIDIRRVPEHLSPNMFFAALLNKALHHMPTAVYPEVRQPRHNSSAGSH